MQANNGSIHNQAQPLVGFGEGKASYSFIPYSQLDEAGRHRRLTELGYKLQPVPERSDREKQSDELFLNISVLVLVLAGSCIVVALLWWVFSAIVQAIGFGIAFVIGMCTVFPAIIGIALWILELPLASWSLSSWQRGIIRDELQRDRKLNGWR
jgi:hypothetical protein